MRPRGISRFSFFVFCARLAFFPILANDSGSKDVKVYRSSDGKSEAAVFTIFSDPANGGKGQGWSVYGTVRDNNGKPLKGVVISTRPGFLRSYGYTPSALTNAEGKYTLRIDPQKSLTSVTTHFEPDAPPVEREILHPILTFNNSSGKTDAFRFLPFILSASYVCDDDWPNLLKDSSRSAKGELIIVGDLAKLKEVKEMKKYVAGKKFDAVFISKNSPREIDFVMESNPSREAALPDYWANRAEFDRRNEVYRKLGIEQETELTSKVSASLRFPKPSIMSGEPMNFQYVVRNDSDADIYISVGGDYRSTGRPESFNLRAIRKDGDKEEIIYQTPVVSVGIGGGLGETPQIATGGGEYAFDLNLNQWLDLNEPGEYIIEAARYLNPSQNTSPTFFSDFFAPSVLRIASGTLIVKPFDE